MTATIILTAAIITATALFLRPAPHHADPEPWTNQLGETRYQPRLPDGRTLWVDNSGDDYALPVRIIDRIWQRTLPYEWHTSGRTPGRRNYGYPFHDHATPSRKRTPRLTRTKWGANRLTHRAQRSLNRQAHHKALTTWTPQP